MLDTIRAVICEKLPMPHAAVWWISEVHRLDKTYHNVDIPRAMREIKNIGLTRELSPYSYDENVYYGYKLDFCFLDTTCQEYEWTYVVVDEEEAARLTERYLKNAQFN
ncbi:hypothetical protein A3D71_01480 [Candidatus Kaiserbacteria bacterium RIFCSPHIGHO2_02_FULL_55_20]|uniref:Uncharacterized protein n=1 Tax=Candidatus Kaiserbacteria bacterium RIFCSPHIGHO2_02_FULL_55_20 TaxID=1798497 RepID=A0A1F6DY07_9BACT|nr:MAG: hypothetical protein A2680_03585 [Candidatus Kaiserbacteria bacterium RIFCSPHIGHO2_01_FULL_55_37]OGG66170.1 MAG: hypothetical protein A3D71_01480 [Candidatus Kaiserbacteria bacterium RIFCSPHIGHO2_02_FULL_55_20]